MVPATLFTRSQSDRTDLFKDQTLDAHGTETNNRINLAPCRNPPRHIAAKEGAGYFKNAGYEYIKN